MRRRRPSRTLKTPGGGGLWPGLAALAGAASFLPSVARACPSCYGSAAGPVIDGMNLAVLVMIGVTGGVFSWIIAFAVRIVRRERRDGQ